MYLNMMHTITIGHTSFNQLLFITYIVKQKAFILYYFSMWMKPQTEYLVASNDTDPFTDLLGKKFSGLQSTNIYMIMRNWAQCFACIL